MDIPLNTIKKLDKVINLIERMPDDELDRLLDEYRIIDELKGEKPQTSMWFTEFHLDTADAINEIRELRSQVTTLEQNLREVVSYLRHKQNSNYECDHELHNVTSRMGIY